MVQEGFKECRSCHSEKPFSDFYKHSSTADGLHPYCLSCARTQNRERYYRRRDGDTSDMRRTRPTGPQASRLCPDCGERKLADQFAPKKKASDGLHTYCKACNTARGVASVTRIYGGTRYYHLKRRYGLDKDEVEALIARQMGVCAICLAAPAAHVDHDHTSSEVRGMLCFNCNGGLGQFKDDPERLQRAIDYLKGARWHTLREASGVYLLCS